MSYRLPSVFCAFIVILLVTGCFGPSASNQQDSTKSQPGETTEVPTATQSEATTTGVPTATQPIAATTTSSSPGQLIVSEASTVPDNATVVNYSDSRVLDSDLLESGFAGASKDGDTWSAELTGEQRTQLQEGFADIPRYEGDKEGYYVRFEGTVFRVNILT